MGFPKTLTPHINDLLNFALAHLRTLLPTFNHYYLSSSTASPPNASEEDHPIELPMLGCPVIDFLAVMTRGSRAKSWLSASNVETLIVTLCGWMQMTEDDVSHRSLWTSLELTACRKTIGATMRTLLSPMKTTRHNPTPCELQALIF